MNEKTLKIKTYFSKDGSPTCAKNFQNKEYCTFLRTEFFGTRDVCIFDDKPLERTKEGLGLLIPCQKCPLHNPELENQAL